MTTFNYKEWKKENAFQSRYTILIIDDTDLKVMIGDEDKYKCFDKSWNMYKKIKKESPTRFKMYDNGKQKWIPLPKAKQK